MFWARWTERSKNQMIQVSNSPRWTNWWRHQKVQVPGDRDLDAKWPRTRFQVIQIQYQVNHLSWSRTRYKVIQNQVIQIQEPDSESPGSGSLQMIHLEPGSGSLGVPRYSELIPSDPEPGTKLSRYQAIQVPNVPELPSGSSVKWPKWPSTKWSSFLKKQVLLYFSIWLPSFWNPIHQRNV